MSSRGARPPVRALFNDDLFGIDVARVSDHGRAALVATRRRLERDGVHEAERAPCRAAHPSGTDLPGCVKVYVPHQGGPWRIVFQVVRLDDAQLGLSYVASGVGHVPGGLRRDVYALAHSRLHGRWPAPR